MTKETEFLLSQWALWSRFNTGKAKGYPTRSIFEEPRHHDDLVITDDEAMIIDQIVAKLSQKDQQIGYATSIFFFYRQNLTKTAERLDTSRRTAKMWITAGIAWIDGVLSFE